MTSVDLTIKYFVMNNIPENFRCAILDKYPNAQNFRIPDVCGTKKNIVFADIGNKTRVFKFGNQGIIGKNEFVSMVYRMNKIPVPNISACQYGDIFFEEYEMLPGKTLFEAIRDGMPADKIKCIYCEILESMVKISKISPSILGNHPYRHVHTVAREHVTNVNNATLGNICMALVYMANIGAKNDKAIIHYDITPKNTIVSNSGHLVGFVDLDSVAIGDINFMFGAMAAKYTQLGFDINELFDYLKKISTKKINRARVHTMANANNLGKKILWNCAQSKIR